MKTVFLITVCIVALPLAILYCFASVKFACWIAERLNKWWNKTVDNLFDNFYEWRAKLQHRCGKTVRMRVVNWEYYECPICHSWYWYRTVPEGEFVCECGCKVKKGEKYGKESLL